jgi:hypothetical protein
LYRLRTTARADERERSSKREHRLHTIGTQPAIPAVYGAKAPLYGAPLILKTPR